ncbi:putative F-box domain, galactose oxidase/kelch, beta-propeller, F-box associated interaction [Medicago truncatula]|nr:putative F-box domain, galactose oxidase/kelch, beta-propeller, F-box associated interaction [Medicago truncatula]
MISFLFVCIVSVALMNFMPPPMTRRRRQSNMSQLPEVILPNEVITEILSWLPVKSLMQMKCVSKSWKTLISHPPFIKMHLSRSARNPYFSSIVPTRGYYFLENRYSFVHFPVSCLLENRWIKHPKDPYYRLSDKNCRVVLGSCNGLICLAGYSINECAKYKTVWFRFWNPATRNISQVLGSDVYFNDMHISRFTVFVFGYDSSTDTYKVVALSSTGNEMRVFSLGDNVWRYIQRFPFGARPVFRNSSLCDGVYLDGTVNWLAYRSDRNCVKKFVIISLDLATETYTEMLLPFDEGLHVWGNVCVLMNSLCVYQDLKETDFVIWKLMEFGNENSWIQFLRFSYHDVQLYHEIGPSTLFRIRPLHLSENGDTLVLANNQNDRAILYNRRTNKARKTIMFNNISWLSIHDYVESLVLIR